MFQVCLSMYDLSVDTKRHKVKHTALYDASKMSEAYSELNETFEMKLLLK